MESKISIRKMANFFYEKTGIEIPEKIISLYSLHRNKEFDFLRLFEAQYEDVKNGLSPYLSILISEEFAKEILNLIYEYSYEERVTILFQEICNYNKEKKINIESNIEDFVLEEILFSVNDYNYIENKFDFFLIQKAYENIGSDFNKMKVILILFGDCGGEGGIIVRGKNRGFSSNYTHGEFSEIEYGGNKVKYLGYLFEQYEKPYW